MLKFHTVYRPITATPFSESISYAEYEPCEALRPYIRCFWGSKRPYKQRNTAGFDTTIVIPDTCMDIIFVVDYTNNFITARFCGIDDRSFVSGTEIGEERIISTFAIRFYPWSAYIFAEDSMRETKNRMFAADQYFPGLKRELTPILFDVVNIEERIAVAEQFLAKNIFKGQDNPCIKNAVAELLSKKGNVGITELTENVPVGSRQLQRLFQEYIGVSPKGLATLIRYQYLWNDILYDPNFCVQDAVFQYGYTDQSHLLHEFKRFHTTTISEAREYALWERSRDVAFLQ